MNPDQFHQWVKTAKKGETVAYHVGHLGIDRGFVSETGKVTPVPQYDSIARAAWFSYREGFVELTQKRMGPVFIYRATRTSRRKS